MGGRPAALLVVLGGLAVVVAAVVGQVSVSDCQPEHRPPPEMLVASTGLSTTGIIISSLSGETRILGEGTRYGMPRWSPDGRFLAAVTDPVLSGDVVLINPDDGSQRVLVDGGWVVAGMAWSRDGNLAVRIQGGPPNGISIYDTDGRRLVFVPGPERPSDLIGIADPIWAPSGEFLVAAIEATTVLVALDGRSTTLPVGSWPLAWDSDGLIIRGKDGRYSSVKLDGLFRRVTPLARAPTRDALFEPDPRLVSRAREAMPGMEPAWRRTADGSGDAFLARRVTEPPSTLVLVALDGRWWDLDVELPDGSPAEAGHAWPTEFDVVILRPYPLVSPTDPRDVLLPGPTWTGQGARGLSEAQARKTDLPAFWLGIRVDRYNLQHIDGEFRGGLVFIYGHCRVVGDACPTPVSVMVLPICEIPPSRAAVGSYTSTKLGK